MDTWREGSRFGELEIVRELGRGAFGRVYLARDTLVGRSVALKVLRVPGAGPADQERDELLREARAVGRLRSPHIATLYRVHALPDGSGWVFELEYVEGGSLEDRLAHEPQPPVADVHRIIRGILVGLAAAHESAVVHGDVKPGNVLLGADGAVKLVDFGLAHFVGEFSVRATRAEVAGTPAYIAPEVIMGAAPAPASDLWSVGVLLYRMLAGRLPFQGRTLPTLLPAILNASPPPLDPGLPRVLTDLALRCLAKSPRARPASCAEALRDLLPAAVADARPAAPPRPLPPATISGRAAEKARLHAAIERAAAGSGTTILLTGELGMGKSALAADAMAQSAGRGFQWVEARVTLIEGLLRPLLGGLRDLLARPSEPRGIESDLFGTATNLLRTLLEEPGPIPLESRQQVVWGLQELLRGLAADRPLGLLVEDAHFANAEDWRLLIDLSGRISSAPVLLCIVAVAHAGVIPNAAPLPEIAGAVEHVQLEPLEVDAMTRLLHERAEGAHVAPEIVRRTLRTAEGNPLFAIELLRHLQESGAVVREGDHLVPGPAWPHAALPRRLRDLALARLADLPEEQRALLDVAAVDGVAFDGESIAAGAGRPLLEVLRTLQGLYRRTGLVTPGGNGYRFAHAVLQEAVYEELAPALRRALHARLARHLEERTGEGAVLPERLGSHWERAGEPARARPHLLRAARDALRRLDHLRAVDLLARAGLAPAELTPEVAGPHAELLLDAAGSYAVLGRNDEVERVLHAVLAAAGDSHLRLQALVRRYQLLYRRQGLVGIDEATLAEAALALPASEYRGRANYLLGMIAKYRGDLDEAERRLQAADRDFVARHPGLHSSALDQLGSVSLRRGRWREAEALYADAARISAVVGRRSNAAASEVNGALAAYMRGALDDLPDRLERAIRTLAREGAAGNASAAIALRGQVELALGAMAAARESAEEALRLARRSGSLAAQVAALALRADTRIAAGALDQGRADIEAERSLAATREDYQIRLEITTSECQIAAILGDHREAQAFAAESLQLLRRAPAAHESALLSLATATLFGLPPAVLDGAMALLDEVGGLANARAVIPAALALATPDAPAEQFRAAATALRGPTIGPQRAALRVVARRFAAEGHRRAGERDAARAEAGNGLREAVALGNVWLEAALLLFLAGLDGGDFAARLASRVGTIASHLGDDAERALLTQHWRPR